MRNVSNDWTVTEDYSASSAFSKYNNSLSRNKTANQSPNVTVNKSYNSCMSGSFNGEELIQDADELQSYMKTVAEKDRKSTPSANVDQPSNLLSSFWSHPATRSPGEVSPLLRRCAYQLAPTVGRDYFSHTIFLVYFCSEN